MGLVRKATGEERPKASGSIQQTLRLASSAGTQRVRPLRGASDDRSRQVLSA